MAPQPGTELLVAARPSPPMRNTRSSGFATHSQRAVQSCHHLPPPPPPRCCPCWAPRCHIPVSQGARPGKQLPGHLLAQGRDLQGLSLQQLQVVSGHPELHPTHRDIFVGTSPCPCATQKWHTAPRDMVPACFMGCSAKHMPLELLAYCGQFPSHPMSTSRLLHSCPCVLL